MFGGIPVTIVCDRYHLGFCLSVGYLDCNFAGWLFVIPVILHRDVDEWIFWIAGEFAIKTVRAIDP